MRRRDEGAYIVVDPHDKREKRTLSVGAAISIAQTWANRRRKDDGRYTFYVQNVLGTTTYATVTKQEDGVIVTRPKVAYPFDGRRYLRGERWQHERRTDRR